MFSPATSIAELLILFWVILALKIEEVASIPHLTIDKKLRKLVLFQRKIKLFLAVKLSC